MYVISLSSRGKLSSLLVCDVEMREGEAESGTLVTGSAVPGPALGILDMTSSSPWTTER